MRLLTLLVAGVLFMEFLDGTVIITALPAMARSFGVTALDLNVGVSAYLFALGVFIPISAWMAERFGAKQVFATAIIIFTVASLLCGMSDSLGVFVVVRVLQGFGGAMMVPVGRQIVLQNTPKDKLISAIAVLVWPALVAPVIGPALGGFITTYADWRWIFFLNIPLGVAALAAALILIPDIRPGISRPFDWAGFLLCSFGIGSFLYGAELLSQSGTNSLLALPLVCAGGILLIVAFFYLKHTTNPLLDLTPFKIPTFATALRGGSVIRAAIGSAPFLLPLMFQLGFGWNAFESGLIVMAVFAGNLIMKLATTPLLRHFGFRPILIWNGVICALSLLVCAFFTPGTPVLLIVFVLFLGGLTRSMQFTAINTIAFADIPQRDIAGANALFSTVFQLSLGAGVAVGAIAVRMGQTFMAFANMSSPATGYRIAFILVSAAAFLSLIDALRLKPGSGDQLANRGRKI